MRRGELELPDVSGITGKGLPVMLDEFKDQRRPKVTAEELAGDGILPGDMVRCIHCDKEFPVSAVLANCCGDYCPTAGCDGGGWWWDLWPVKECEAAL